MNPIKQGIFTILLVLLVGCGGGGSDSPTPESPPTPAPKSPPTPAPESTPAPALPVANAGVDQSVWVNNDVIFNASSSTLDANGSFTYSWKEGETALSTASTFTKSDLSAGTHTITLTITDNLGNISSDDVVIDVKVITLNDTGLTWGGNYPSGNNADCSGNDIEAQDCSHGRDAQALAGTLTKVGGGNAGFDFTKLDSNGDDLTIQDASWSDVGSEENGTQWSCVQDNHTGFMWEVKTTDGGLRDKGHTYSWFDTNSATNGGADGTANGGICVDSENCDTQKYVTQVNLQGLCGFNDWRLPSQEVLHSIVDYSTDNPSIDTTYYSNTALAHYWSSDAFPAHGDYAKAVIFGYGGYSILLKNSGNIVRLVRGGQ